MPPLNEQRACTQLQTYQNGLLTPKLINPDTTTRNSIDKDWSPQLANRSQNLIQKYDKRLQKIQQMHATK